MSKKKFKRCATCSTFWPFKGWFLQHFTFFIPCDQFLLTYWWIITSKVQPWLLQNITMKYKKDTAELSTSTSPCPPASNVLNKIHVPLSVHLWLFTFHLSAKHCHFSCDFFLEWANHSVSAWTDLEITSIA